MSTYHAQDRLIYDVLNVGAFSVIVKSSRTFVWSCMDGARVKFIPRLTARPKTCHRSGPWPQYPGSIGYIQTWLAVWKLMKGSIDSFDMSCFSLYGPAVLTFLSQNDKKWMPAITEPYLLSTWYSLELYPANDKWSSCRRIVDIVWEYHVRDPGSMMGREQVRCWAAELRLGSDLMFPLTSALPGDHVPRHVPRAREIKTSVHNVMS